LCEAFAKRLKNIEDAGTIIEALPSKATLKKVMGPEVKDGNVLVG
jgi:hypothetical protein